MPRQRDAPAFAFTGNEDAANLPSPGLSGSH